MQIEQVGHNNNLDLFMKAVSQAFFLQMDDILENNVNVFVVNKSSCQQKTESDT